MKNIGNVLLFVYFSIYIAIMRFLKAIIIFMPENILGYYKPRATIQVGILDSESESDSESDDLPADIQNLINQDFNSGHRSAKIYDKVIKGYITYAVIFDDITNPKRIENKISCWSVIDHITIDAINQFGTGKYFFMLILDSNGFVYKVLIDMVKKKDLIHNVPILFSKVQILVN